MATRSKIKPSQVKAVDKETTELKNENKLLLNIITTLTKKNISDPNLDLFIGVLKNDIDKVKEALNKGANPNITDASLIKYYANLLEKENPESFKKYCQIKGIPINTRK